MSDDTHYSVLGVSERATQSEIKAAYRNLLKKIHPDTVSTLSPELRCLADQATKDLTEAYSVLADASKRRQYDGYLAEHRQASVSSPTGSHPSRVPQAWSQTSPTASNPLRQQRIDDEDPDEDPYVIIPRWASTHPALASLLAALLVLLLILLYFQFDAKSG